MRTDHARLPERIERWPVERLVPYARNARTHSAEQIEKIAASIREFGFTNPILVADAGILAGHGRLRAAQAVGLAEVPVIDLSHLTDAQRRAYILADNRLALDAGWDEVLLAEELQALKADGFKVEVIGFSDEELERLLGAGVEEELDEETEDDAPAVPAEPVTRKGDLWIMGGHRVLCGDATSIDDVQRLVGKTGVDCLWTDPPYNVAYEGAAGAILNDALAPEDFQQLLLEAFHNSYAVMKPGASFYIAHPDCEVVTFVKCLEAAAFRLARPQTLIWRKNALVLGQSDYHSQHEPILYGWREGGPHRFFGGRDKTTIQELGDAVFTQTADDTWQISLGEETLVLRGAGITVERVRGTVFFEEKPTRSAEHPTMKPVALIERMLANSTQRGEVVLDLFGGSGSTLIAAHKLARRARLVELDPKFCDVIVRRWQEYTGHHAKLEGDSRTFDELAAERLATS